MRKFDPWPVFSRREFARTWPFLVGFAITGTLITKMTLGLTEEDSKNSPFVQKHKRVAYNILENQASLHYTPLGFSVNIIKTYPSIYCELWRLETTSLKIGAMLRTSNPFRSHNAIPT